MKNFLSIFTRNWWLKLLALVLALAVFYGVRGSFPFRTHDAGLFMRGDAHADR